MGCQCNTNKEINVGEYNFDEENNNNFINLINQKIQRDSTEQDLQEIQMMKDRFLGEIQNRENYEILDSINLREYLTYECLQAYNIFTNDKQKFIKIVNEYEKDFINDKSEIFDNNNNYQNSKIFKMPPIKYIKNNSIYEGEFFFDEKNNQFKFAGDGCLITSNKELIEFKNQPIDSEFIERGKIFYPSGDIFIGTICREEPYYLIKGVLFENTNGNYNNHSKSNNFSDDSPFIIKHFKNGDIYEGEATLKLNKVVLDGKGKLTKKDKNTIFNGDFKGNLYNGQGRLFKPLGGLSEENNVRENIGKTIISNWINGKPNGKGIIQEKYSSEETTKSTTCSFRFGKIIRLTSCLVKEKKVLNENIFSFLNIWELSILSNKLKTKSFYNFLTKNNNYNFRRINIYKALRKLDIGNYKKEIFNDDIFKLNINNLDDIINSIYSNKNAFLPFVCYRTDGGEIEQRYRAFHIFDPDVSKIYSTHYLLHKDTNVTINGIFNRNLHEKFITNEEQYNENTENIIDNLMLLASLYKNLYESFEKYYPVRNIYSDVIEYKDYIISDDKIGNINNILCTFQYITIFIPDKKDDYTVLINPCYFLAVYIGKYNNGQILVENENQNEINTNSKNYIDIDNDEIEENDYDLRKIKEKYNKYAIKEEINPSFEFIEFDTNIQKEYEYQLLCLVKIKEKNDLSEPPYLIGLKKLYHLGNVVNVKLINQLNVYNKNERGYSIDFGTINFYGDILYLNQ